MNKIKSFCVDHRKLSEGIYISRIDGDVVTYDLRFVKPNSDYVLDNSSIHTAEHMMATFLRNSKYAGEILYFGPMGCQTGFYLLVHDILTPNMVLDLVKETLKAILEYEGEVFGASEIECGNYKNLNLESAKKACGLYLGILNNVSKIVDYDEVNKRN